MSDSTHPGSPPSHRPPRHRAPAVLAGRVIAVLLAVGLIVVAAGALYLWNLSSTYDADTQKLSEVFPADDARPPVIEAEPGQTARAQNILVLGSDQRGSAGASLEDMEGQRSDTIMVVHVSADRETVHVMSILRDSWLEIPGYGQAKVNSAFARGGVPLAVATVEGLIGARIDHVAVADFEGFGAATDAVGGVEVDNEIGFDSYHMPGRYFEAGVHRLNGEEALAFVRERYAFADGDFQRARNQQAFIRALLLRTLRAEASTNPAAMGDMIRAIAPYLTVDEGLDFGYLMDLRLELSSVSADEVKFFTLPTAGTGTADGQSMVNIDWDEMPALRKAFQDDSLEAYRTKDWADR